MSYDQDDEIFGLYDFADPLKCPSPLGDTSLSVPLREPSPRDISYNDTSLAIPIHDYHQSEIRKLSPTRYEEPLPSQSTSYQEMGTIYENGHQFHSNGTDQGSSMETPGYYQMQPAMAPRPMQQMAPQSAQLSHMLSTKSAPIRAAPAPVVIQQPPPPQQQPVAARPRPAPQRAVNGRKKQNARGQNTVGAVLAKANKLATASETTQGEVRLSVENTQLVAQLGMEIEQLKKDPSRDNSAKIRELENKRAAIFFEALAEKQREQCANEPPPSTRPAHPVPYDNSPDSPTYSPQFMNYQQQPSVQYSDYARPVQSRPSMYKGNTAVYMQSMPMPSAPVYPPRQQPRPMVVKTMPSRHPALTRIAPNTNVISHPVQKGAPVMQSPAQSAKLIQDKKEKRMNRLRQLMCEMVEELRVPSTEVPFQSRDEALRRLLPYHFHYEPNLKQELLDSFDAQHLRVLLTHDEEKRECERRVRKILYADAMKGNEDMERNLLLFLEGEADRREMEQEQIPTKRDLKRHVSLTQYEYHPFYISETKPSRVLAPRHPRPPSPPSPSRMVSPPSISSPPSSSRPPPYPSFHSITPPQRPLPSRTSVSPVKSPPSRPLAPRTLSPPKQPSPWKVSSPPKPTPPITHPSPVALPILLPPPPLRVPSPSLEEEALSESSNSPELGSYDEIPAERSVDATSIAEENREPQREEKKEEGERIQPLKMKISLGDQVNGGHKKHKKKKKKKKRKHEEDEDREERKRRRKEEKKEKREDREGKKEKKQERDGKREKKQEREGKKDEKKHRHHSHHPSNTEEQVPRLVLKIARPPPPPPTPPPPPPPVADPAPTLRLKIRLAPPPPAPKPTTHESSDVQFSDSDASDSEALESTAERALGRYSLGVPLPAPVSP